MPITDHLPPLDLQGHIARIDLSLYSRCPKRNSERNEWRTLCLTLVLMGSVLFMAGMAFMRGIGR